MAIEMDYRFEHAGVVFNREIFMSHIQVIHAMVVRYICDADLRLMLYASSMKPKYDDQSKRWMVAVGFHLLYNRRISTEMGAQVTHACSIHLKTVYGKSVIDNLYVNPRSGALKTVVQLRPPYSSKKIKCFYCNDNSLKNDNPKNIDEVDPIIPDCIMCQNKKECQDINCYVLQAVYQPDFKIDEVFDQKLRADRAYELSMTSIWGAPHPVCNPIRPDTLPLYTTDDMKVVHVPQKKLPVVQKNGFIKPAHTIGLLKHFGHLGLKRKDDPGRYVEMSNDILQKARQFLTQLDSKYSNTTVSKITAFETEAKKRSKHFDGGETPKKLVSFQLQLSGEGSTYCMAKKSCHNSNRAQIWITETNVYAGCWSKHCEGFAQIDRQSKPKFGAAICLLRDACHRYKISTRPADPARHDSVF
jgi:hypothetical protein